MDPTVTRLRALLGKIDLTIEMVAIHEPLMEARSIIIAWLDELGEHINNFED